MTNEQKKERFAALIAELQSLLVENEPVSRYSDAINLVCKTKEKRERCEEMMAEACRCYEEATGINPEGRVHFCEFDGRDFGVSFDHFLWNGSNEKVLSLDIRFRDDMSMEDIKKYIKESIERLTNQPEHD